MSDIENYLQENKDSSPNSPFRGLGGYPKSLKGLWEVVDTLQSLIE